MTSVHLYSSHAAPLYRSCWQQLFTTKRRVKMLFKIFNGVSRGLGEDGHGRDIYAQIGVEFRDYLNHFKGAKFSVFMCLLLHSDEDGWSFPGIELIACETGYSVSEI